MDSSYVSKKQEAYSKISNFGVGSSPEEELNDWLRKQLSEEVKG